MRVKLDRCTTDKLVINLLLDEKGFKYPCYINTRINECNKSIEYDVIEGDNLKRVTNIKLYDYRLLLNEALEKKGFYVRRLDACVKDRDISKLYYELFASEVEIKRKKMKR